MMKMKMIKMMMMLVLVVVATRLPGRRPPPPLGPRHGAAREARLQAPWQLPRRDGSTATTAAPHRLQPHRGGSTAQTARNIGAGRPRPPEGGCAPPACGSAGASGGGPAPGGCAGVTSAMAPWGLGAACGRASRPPAWAPTRVPCCLFPGALAAGGAGAGAAWALLLLLVPRSEMGHRPSASASSDLEVWQPVLLQQAWLVQSRLLARHTDPRPGPTRRWMLPVG